jgi:hypothetical protein
MEFHVRAARPLPPLVAIEDALRAFDPAAVVDIDPDRGLRVSAAIEATQLVAMLDLLGATVDRAEVVRQASVCCGGCSG